MIAAHSSITGVAYAFPHAVKSVRELSAAGQLHSDPALLEEFGFGRVHVATTETPFEMALCAASSVLRQCAVDPATVGALIYAGTPAVAFAAGGGSGAARVNTTQRFHYPATRLQHELGLENAATFAVDQLACTSLFSAVRIANALCLTGEAERVLCVCAEFFPADAGREAIFNCTSDAACAVLIERGGAGNRIVASTQITKGYYWNVDEMRNEVVASYFPTSKHVVAETLRRAQWKASDVKWVIPHNVSVRSWDILMALIGIPRERLWSQNISRDGHTLAGDNFINLRDAIDSGSITRGDKLLLFSYGYGAHWTALAVEA